MQVAIFSGDCGTGTAQSRVAIASCASAESCEFAITLNGYEFTAPGTFKVCWCSGGSETSCAGNGDNGPPTTPPMTPQVFSVQVGTLDVEKAVATTPAPIPQTGAGTTPATAVASPVTTPASGNVVTSPPEFVATTPVPAGGPSGQTTVAPSAPTTVSVTVESNGQIKQTTLPVTTNL
jgi:hypothetical protein